METRKKNYQNKEREKRKTPDKIVNVTDSNMKHTLRKKRGINITLGLYRL